MGFINLEINQLKAEDSIYIMEKKVAIYRRIGLQVISSLFLSLISSTALAFDPKVIEHEGSTYLVGSVISTPCSIVMSNRYQTVDFSSLTLAMLSSKRKNANSRLYHLK